MVNVPENERIEMPKNGTFLVGFDFTHGAELMIVGEPSGNGTTEIINSFAGDKARLVYDLLTKNEG